MTKAFALSSSLLLVLGLAACAPPPEPEPVPQVQPILDPLAPVDRTPGLNDKEPDTCHAVDQLGFVGQPATAVDAAGLTQQYRIVYPGAIESQQEYFSARVNFHTDATGTVVRITCG